MKRGVARPRSGSADEALVGSDVYSRSSSRLPSPVRTSETLGYSSATQLRPLRSTSLSPVRRKTSNPTQSNESVTKTRSLGFKEEKLARSSGSGPLSYAASLSRQSQELQSKSSEEMIRAGSREKERRKAQGRRLWDKENLPREMDVNDSLDSSNRSLTGMKELYSSRLDDRSRPSMRDFKLQTQLEEAQRRIERLRKSMQTSDRQDQANKEKLNKQTEEMARLQSHIGGKEAETAALRREVGKLKNYNRDLSKELEARNKLYRENINSRVRPREVIQRLSDLTETLQRSTDILHSVRSDDPLDHSLTNIEDNALELEEYKLRIFQEASEALQALEKHATSLKKKLVEAQVEHRETIIAATDAKVDSEKKVHEKALRRLEVEMKEAREGLKQAESDVALVKTIAQREKGKREAESRERGAKLRNEKDSKIDEVRVGRKEHDARQSDRNKAKIATLHRKLQLLEDKPSGSGLNNTDIDSTASKALRILATVEEEISALEELLHAHEEDGENQSTVRRLLKELLVKSDEVDRLRKALSLRKLLSPEEVDDLLSDVNALRKSLTSKYNYIRALWPGYYYFLPNGNVSSGIWLPNDRTSSHTAVRYGSTGPLTPWTTLQGIPVNSLQSIMQPGTPGIIALKDDGSMALLPFDGLFCNVQEHHGLEDEVIALQETLAKLKERRKSEVEDTMKVIGSLNEGEAKLKHLKELIRTHEELLEKTKSDKEKVTKEKNEAAKELADIKEALTNKQQRKRQLEERIGILLGQLQSERAIVRKENIQDELFSLERSLLRKKEEIKDAEEYLKEAREEAGRTQEKAKLMMKRYESAVSGLNETEEDAEELERQANDTGMKLVRTRTELKQLQQQGKEAEARKNNLEDQNRELARLLMGKKTEFASLEQKSNHVIGSLERLQSELILTEGKETEKVAALKESDKVLSEKQNEIKKLNDQAVKQREELEGLDRILGKRKTELQLLQESIEEHRSDLEQVLKEGKTDVQDKQMQIKQLKQGISDLTANKSELEKQISRRRSEVVSSRESCENTSEELQNKIAEVKRQKSELVHVLEMLGLEQQELDSVKIQRESKAADLAQTQRKLLEEKAELERINSDMQRKEADLSRVKLSVDNVRSDVDYLTSQRSTLEETVTSLLKEKEMLSITIKNLEEKAQNSKKNLHEIRSGVDQSESQLEDLEQELNQLRKTVYESNQEKTKLNKELTSMTSVSNDLKLEISSYKTELQETQEKLHLAEQNLRSSTRHHDDITMETRTLHEELKSRGHELEILTQVIKRKKEEASKTEENAKEKRKELEEKEEIIERLSRDIDKEEGRLSRTVADLNQDVKKLSEQKDKLALTVSKRESAMREAERLGGLDGRRVEIEAQVCLLESQIAEQQRELQQVQRERAELKGSLLKAEGELNATRLEAEDKIRRLQEKVTELREEIEKLKRGSANEITSLEQIAQDHRERAGHMTAEVNQLRSEIIRLKQEVRFHEEEREKLNEDLQRSARRIRDEVDDNASGIVVNLDASHRETLQDIKELFDHPTYNQERLIPLREVRGSRSPLRCSSPIEDEGLIQNLHENFKVRQEEITSQIRRQMKKHKEQWQVRKLLSEGKLQTLRKKVSSLDELMSNSSSNSLFRSRSLSPIRRLTIAERENALP